MRKLYVDELRDVEHDLIKLKWALKDGSAKAIRLVLGDSSSRRAALEKLRNYTKMQKLLNKFLGEKL